MSEIKYRAWNGTEIQDVVKLDLWSDFPEEHEFELREGETYESEEVSLMKFVGIQDKNNRDIYTDYIVKYTRTIYTDCSRSEIEKQDDPIIGTIYYAEGLWLGIKLKDGTGRLFHPGQLSANESNEEFEVLGNIYENPELLESASNEGVLERG